ncbi:MAG: hypothetical protein Q7T54_01120 [Candidatus Levybacteria bacterium]|nr:hypothetical protein [Candidatus Levybacteria bacterium]
MEKEEVVASAPHKRRKVSLFRRRKKAEIRPFVKAKKHREYKKIIRTFLIFLAVIATLSAFLYLIRFYVIEFFVAKNEELITPQGTVIIDDNRAKEIIEESRLPITGITFATEAALISFTLNGKTKVIVTKYKDIGIQMDLVEAIDRQVTLDGKQAISIDLRYNKPIVKF